jgi:hypothetical protein
MVQRGQEARTSEATPWPLPSHSIIHSSDPAASPEGSFRQATANTPSHSGNINLSAPIAFKMGDRNEIQWLYCMVFDYTDETTGNRRAILEKGMCVSV